MKKSGLYVFFPVVIMILFGLDLTASAQEKDEDAVYRLGEVVVSAKKAGVESVGTVREVTAEDIRTRRVETLDEAIRLLPGVTVRTGAQGVPRIDIRGLRTRHVILLLDGVPFNSTFDGQFDPTIIPVESIARIKLSYGTHSTLYRDGGLGGVINIITKKGGMGFRGEASAEAGEGDRRIGRLNLSGGKNRTDFFISGSTFDMDGYKLSNDFQATIRENGGLRENSDKERDHVFANVGYSLNDEIEVGLIFDYIQGKYGIPPSTIDQDLFASRIKYERVDDMEGITGNISGSYDPDGPLSLRGWLYANELEEVKNQYDDATYTTQEDLSITGLYHEENRVTITGGNLQTFYETPFGGSLALGIGTRQESYATKGRRVERRNNPFVPFDERNEVDTHSASLEYEAVPYRDIGLVLGYSHHWFKKMDGKDDDKGGFLIGSHYDLSEDTRIRGSAARKIRFPSIRNLYDSDGGNPDLTTEESLNYELGVDHSLTLDTTISVTGFLLDVEDYIEKDTNGIFQNNEKYRFQGVELDIETRPFKGLIMGAGYTYMDSKDKSTGTQKDELQYRPKHKLTLEGRYDFMYGFSAHMSMEHIKDQFYYSRNAPIIKAKLGDFTLVNLKLEKSFLGERLGAYLGADNIFDEDYEESYAYPQAGRMIYGGMRFRF